MQTITIYSTVYCGYCSAAKELLTSKGIAFEEVDLTNDPVKREELSTMHDYHTVPMIFIGDTFIGGYSDLATLDRSGALAIQLAA